MASWLNLPSYNAGDLVSGSMIDAILDDIAMLSIHTHSGSAGDGSASISGLAVISNAGAIFPYTTTREQSLMFSASHSNWGVISPNTEFYYPAYRGVTDTSVSGACIVFQYNYSLTASGSIVLTTMFAATPSSGCVDIYVNSSLIGGRDLSSSPGTQFIVACTLNNQSAIGVLNVKFIVTNKNASSVGYKADIYNLKFS